jgi:Major tropism determinant N-terminal domain
MGFGIFQLRRGTAAEWTAANPVLASGEQGFESDTRRIKVGDGTTPWSLLPYASGPGGATGFDYVQAVPATVWTINHNLGYRPTVGVFSPGGVEVEADVLHVSLNQTTITFNAAYSGFARLV